MNIALIIAGGVGVRMGADIPKQFLKVDNKPVVAYTMEVFQKHSLIDVIAVVCVDGWTDDLAMYAKQYSITKLKHIILGGKNGQDSIRNGVYELEKIYGKDAIVLIHDAIRPLLSGDIIVDCIKVTEQYGNAITVIPCAEAMLVTDNQINSSELYPRDQLKRTQTPQGFRLGAICDLHRRALEKGITNSVASCTLMVEMGEKVYFCKGSEKNIKLTTPDDMDIFRALLSVEQNKK